MITRRHFMPLHKPAHPSMPPPLHVESFCSPWYPTPRPLEAGGEMGPRTIGGGQAYDSLGIDPTDPATWAGRGYCQSTGMIGLPELNRLPRPMPASSLSAVPKGRQR